MAKLTLYHAAPSRSSITRWMLEEIGEPYDIHLLSLNKGDNRAPDYLAVNPMGKVPALKHGDVVITEAAAICAYLADEFPRAKLNVPVGDPRRGVYLKWLFFGPSCIEPAMMDRALPRKEEARRGHARLRGFRHGHGRGGEGGRQGALSHGRPVHCRRRGHRLRRCAGARCSSFCLSGPEFTRLCRPPCVTPGAAAFRSAGQGARRGIMDVARDEAQRIRRNGPVRISLTLHSRYLRLDDTGAAHPLFRGPLGRHDRDLVEDHCFLGCGGICAAHRRSQSHPSLGAFAAKTQFGKRIAHGLYTASLISAVLGTRLPGPARSTSRRRSISARRCGSATRWT